MNISYGLLLYIVKLSIMPENNEHIIVDLNKVESFLANENLPLWTIQDAKLQKLNSKKVYKLK